MMTDQAAINLVKTKYRALREVLDERVRRQWAAAEAMSIGWGGIKAVSEATGLDRNTISAGIHELEERAANPDSKPSSRIRAEGGGRKSVSEYDPGLIDEIGRAHV